MNVIQSGTEKLVEILDSRRDEQQTKQWRDTRSRLDSILISTHSVKSDEARKLCQQLDDMDIEARQGHIRAHWGGTALNKAMPLLQQLDALERYMAQHSPI